MGVIFFKSTRKRDSCRELFKILNIPPPQSQYIFLLLRFFMDMDQYQVNSNIHGKDIRGKPNLHETTPYLSLFQRDT